MPALTSTHRSHHQVGPRPPNWLDGLGALRASEWMTWHFRFVLIFINMVIAKDVRLGQTLACLCQTLLH
eukprot:5088447-Amphidinium_carterae.1